MIESGVAIIGAPKAVVGLLIASIVLLPEAIAAILAVRQNKLQAPIELSIRYALCQYLCYLGHHFIFGNISICT